MEINKFMEMFDLDEYVNTIRDAYRDKRDVMIKAMEENFPSCVHWEKPEGGLFIWVTLPENVDSKDILKVCLESRVMFVTGSMFYPNPGINNTLRLNFSNMKAPEIIEGITRMGFAIKKAINV